jgi:hypothetical protein
VLPNQIVDFSAPARLAKRAQINNSTTQQFNNYMRGTLTSETHDVPADAEAFYSFAELRGWGDGLPLVPPTPERCRRCSIPSMSRRRP